MITVNRTRPLVPTESTAQTLDQPRRFVLTLEQSIYLGLLALALLAHLWGLGDRALHHDETHHAYYPWLLYMGRGYVHDPLLHGPFLYFINALMYFLFGDSNFTARLAVALFGTALVGLPYLIRRELGRGAALIAAVYLLISPAILYVGRFDRHDMFAIVFELLTLISIVRYASTRQARWLSIGAAALGFMFTNLETFYLYVAIFLPLLAVLFFWRVWRPGIALAGALGVAILALVFVLPGEPQRGGGGEVSRQSGPYVCPSGGNLALPDNPMIYTPGPLLGLPPLATADNNYGTCVRNQGDNDFAAYFVKLGQFFSHPAILTALVVSLIGLILCYVLIWRRRDKEGRTVWERARGDDGLYAAFASLGQAPRVLIAALIFFVIYTLLFTAFFTNSVGILSGAAGSVLYWLAQHDVQRGGQPLHYYLVLLIVYEPLVLLWSVVGVAMVGVQVVQAVRRKRAQVEHEAPAPTSADQVPMPIDWSLALPAILAWWSVAAVLIYSWAGEKMPWLVIHLVLPLTLLGSWALARSLSWGLRAAFAPRQVAPLDAAPAEHNGLAELPAASAPHAADHNGLAELPAASVSRPQLPRPLLIFLGAFALVIFSFVQLMNQVTAPGQVEPTSVTAVTLFGLVIVLLVVICYGLLRGVREALVAGALGLTLVGGVYTVRSAYQLSYRYGDIPREMMIFVQTSPDVARLINRLEQVSTAHTGGLDLPIIYDNETIWKWYFRNFTNAQETGPQLGTAPAPEVQVVFMLQENMNPQNIESLRGFRIQQLPLRWWLPEESVYRLAEGWRDVPVDQTSLVGRVLRAPFDGTTIAQAWRYMIYRDPGAPLGSTDFVIAVRPELADELAPGLGAETR